MACGILDSAKSKLETKTADSSSSGSWLLCTFTPPNKFAVAVAAAQIQMLSQYLSVPYSRSGQGPEFEWQRNDTIRGRMTPDKRR